MAMRPRGGRAGPNREPRAILARVYEPFKPMSEWRQGDDYDTLLVYLPGFQKEYIKVTTEDLNMVRVRGERLVAGNKWSRFQEDFRVPENCEMRGIRARFEGGILTITMPRKIITAPPPPTTTAPPLPTTTAPPLPTTTTQVAPKAEEPPLVQKPKDNQDSKQKANESEKKPEKPQTTTKKPQTTTKVAPKPPLTQRKEQETLVQKPKDHQDSKQKATSALETEKKPEKPQTPLEGSSSTLTKQEPSKTARDEQFTFGSSVPKKDKDDGTVDKGKSKEAVVEEEKKMGLESRKGESEGGKVVENAAVKGGNGWRGLNEDRKMVVNMGVALLVIVALGFHVSYTIGLIGKGSN